MQTQKYDGGGALERPTTGRPRLLVIGDVMLDRYLWGDVERISPEAPAPVVEIRGETKVPGGAGNVAMNLAVLDCKVSLVGAVGADKEGETLLGILKNAGVDIDGIYMNNRVQTTVKTRIMARHQQLLRLDSEMRSPIADELCKNLSSFVHDNVDNFDCVLVSDYAKGLLTHDFLKRVMEASKRANIKILIDPKGENYEKYEGCDLIKPNMKNALSFARQNDMQQVPLMAIADKMREVTSCEAVAITRGREGISLFWQDQEFYIPAMASDVFDVTGAGDTVLAVLGLMVGQGYDYREAVEWSNAAAGLVVRKPGTSVVTWEEILDFRDNRRASKVRRLEDLKNVTVAAVAAGKRIVFTNGCFDLLHVGHIKLLERAKSLGDVLIVALNSDASIRRLKGDSRPVVSEKERIRMISSLECVDYVTVFNESTPNQLISELKPHILVKGADYRLDEVVGKEIVESYGGKVELIPLYKGVSTTELISRIRAR